MKNSFRAMLCLTAGIFTFSGCVSRESQVRETLTKNPQLVFDVIEQNPEKFIEVVNRAAQKAQAQQIQRRQKELETAQAAEIKNPKMPELNPSRRLWGNDQGKITIVEYGDFQCPPCGMAYKALKEFKEKNKNNVQFYFKNFPLDFHKAAYSSALYFEALRLQNNSLAQKFYDDVFQNQRSLDENYLKNLARRLGADMKRLKDDLNSDRVKSIIAQDQKEFEGFGFTGTPSIVINGVTLNGAPTLAEIERVAALSLKK